LATLRAFLGVFSYYRLVMLFLNMVCLTVALGNSSTISSQTRNKSWPFKKSTKVGCRSRRMLKGW
jgi:hypothetical protein